MFSCRSSAASGESLLRQPRGHPRRPGVRRRRQPGRPAILLL